MNPRTLEAERLPVPGETYDVSFSPDGQRVLYATTEGLGRGSELWVMNSDGSSATRLLCEPQHIVALPRWAPDGTRLAYIRMVDNEVPFTVGELWVADENGAWMPSEQADAGHGYGPVWSPDGRSIAFVAGENAADRDADAIAGRLASNIYLAEVAAGQVRAVTRFEGTLVEEPVWTADGRRLVFIAGSGGEADGWEVEVSTGVLRRMTHGAGVRLVTWLPGAGR